MPSTATRLAWITFIAVRRGPMDVGRGEYCGPTVVAELASAMQTAYLANDRAATEILDAGYGTGLVGVQLKQSVGSDVPERETASGFSCSMDSTSQMRWPRKLANSRLPPCQRRCRPQRAALQSPHCEARHYSLLRRELARVTRSNGFVITRIRKSYAEETYFGDEVRRLHKTGIIAVVH
ncbi:Type 11 methyltransferase (fragment) [Mesorhizobium delmotii]|uniref:Type 11 methyltransferase n=1 Tax=Mesorhizobium delmotii TaxID=1631247 RepID=A0A2P9ANC1_9HYPH